MIRPFILYRTEDESGVSGTGQVAEGVVFTDGTAVLRWTASYVSTAVYDSLETLLNIHGHDGKTEAVFPDSSYESFAHWSLSDAVYRLTNGADDE